MFDYGDNKYRFISDEPINIGDDLIIGSNDRGNIIAKCTKIIEQRPDVGKWGKQVFSNTLIAKP